MYSVTESLTHWECHRCCGLYLQTRSRLGVSLPEEPLGDSRRATFLQDAAYLIIRTLERRKSMMRSNFQLCYVVLSPNAQAERAAIGVALPLTWEDGPSSVPAMLTTDPELALMILCRTAIESAGRATVIEHLDDVTSALELHAANCYVVEAGLGLLRNLAVESSFRAPLMPYVPLAVDALARHIDSRRVQVAGMGLLCALAAEPTIAVPLMAHVDAVVSGISRHMRDSQVVEAGLDVLTRLAGSRSETNKLVLMAHVGVVIAALTAVAAHVGKDDLKDHVQLQVAAMTFLWNLSLLDVNKVPLMAHLDVVVRALAPSSAVHDDGAARVVDSSLRLLWSLAVDSANITPIMTHVDLVVDALARHSETKAVDHGFKLLCSLAFLEGNRVPLLARLDRLVRLCKQESQSRLFLAGPVRRLGELLCSHPANRFLIQHCNALAPSLCAYLRSCFSQPLTESATVTALFVEAVKGHGFTYPLPLLEWVSRNSTRTGGEYVTDYFVSATLDLLSSNLQDERTQVFGFNTIAHLKCANFPVSQLGEASLAAIRMHLQSEGCEALVRAALSTCCSLVSSGAIKSTGFVGVRDLLVGALEIVSTSQSAKTSVGVVLQMMRLFARLTGDVKLLVRANESTGISGDQVGLSPGLSGSVSALQPCLTFKLLLVGKSEAGKTSFLKAVRHALGGGLLGHPEGRHFVRHLRGTALEDRTVGIDVGVIPVEPSQVPRWCLTDTTEKPLHFASLLRHNKCRLLTHDSAGHTEFYGSHQPFMTLQCLYIIVYRITSDDQSIHQSVQEWAANILHRLNPSSGAAIPVLLVGTHAQSPSNDAHSMSTAAQAIGPYLLDGRVSLLSHIAVDCRTGVGIGRCLQAMFRSFDNPALFGDLLQCPRQWNRLVDAVVDYALETRTLDARAIFPGPVLTWATYTACCEPLGFQTEELLRRATEFLDVIGVVIYKGGALSPGGGSDGLADIVVVQPSVVVDAMSSIIAPIVHLPGPAAQRGRKQNWCEVCECDLDGIIGLTGMVRKRVCFACSRVFCNVHIHGKVSQGEWVCRSCALKQFVSLEHPQAIKENSKEQERYAAQLDMLRTRGVLSQQLLRRLWRRFPSFALVDVEDSLLRLLLFFDFICEAPAGWAGNAGPLRSRHFLVPSICVVRAPALRPLANWRQWEFDVSMLPIGGWSPLVCSLARMFSAWQRAVDVDPFGVSPGQDRASLSGSSRSSPSDPISGSPAPGGLPGAITWEAGQFFVRIRGAGRPRWRIGVEVAEVRLCASGKVIVAGAYECMRKVGPTYYDATTQASRNWELCAVVLQRVGSVVHRFCMGAELLVVCPVCVEQVLGKKRQRPGDPPLPIGRISARAVTLASVVGLEDLLGFPGTTTRGNTLDTEGSNGSESWTSPSRAAAGSVVSDDITLSMEPVESGTAGIATTQHVVDWRSASGSVSSSVGTGVSDMPPTSSVSGVRSMYCSDCKLCIPVRALAPGQLSVSARAVSLPGMPADLKGLGATVVAQFGTDSLVKVGRRSGDVRQIILASSKGSRSAAACDFSSGLVNRRRMEVSLTLSSSEVDASGGDLQHAVVMLLLKVCTRRLYMFLVPDSSSVQSRDWICFWCQACTSPLGMEVVIFRVCNVAPLPQATDSGIAYEDGSMGPMRRRVKASAQLLCSVSIDVLASYIGGSGAASMPQADTVAQQPTTQWLLMSAIVSAIREVHVSGATGQLSSTTEFVYCQRCMRAPADYEPSSVDQLGLQSYLQLRGTGHEVSPSGSRRDVEGDTKSGADRAPNVATPYSQSTGQHPLNQLDQQLLLLPCDMSQSYSSVDPQRFGLVIAVDKLAGMESIELHQSIGRARSFTTVLRFAGFSVTTAFNECHSMVLDRVSAFAQALEKASLTLKDTGWTVGELAVALHSFGSSSFFSLHNLGCRSWRT
jgi:GTPase SAR1 family protein